MMVGDMQLAESRGVVLKFDQAMLIIYVYELNRRTGRPKKKPTVTMTQLRQYFTESIVGAKIFRVIVTVVCQIGNMVHGPFTHEGNFLTVACTPRA